MPRIKSLYILTIVYLLVSFPSVGHASHGGQGSGGGQGVYDAKTGQVRFLDILSDEELRSMQIVRNPGETVMSKFQKCTKTRSKELEGTIYGSSVSRADLILEEIEPYFGIYWAVSNFAYHEITRMITSIRLKQLKDTTRVPPDFQLQLAIYKDGASIFQEQALALMPKEDIQWLVVKEILRFFADRANVTYENEELEEALRFLYQKRYEAFLNSSFFTKVMQPLDSDSAKVKEFKKHFLRTDPRKIPSRLETDRILLDENGNLEPKDGPSNEFYFPSEYLFFKEHPMAIEIKYGYLPRWAFSFEGISEKAQPRTAPALHGFDNETGDLVFAPFAACSK
jgi:hypothetical protein